MKKPKRIVCHICKRKRMARFIEWHPGIEEWQCKDWANCDLHNKPKLQYYMPQT